MCVYCICVWMRMRALDVLAKILPYFFDHLFSRQSTCLALSISKAIEMLSTTCIIGYVVFVSFFFTLCLFLYIYSRHMLTNSHESNAMEKLTDTIKTKANC